MIDLQHEQLVPIRMVPKLLPRHPNGKRLHISAVYRWMERGRKGVHLEWIKIGGRRYTSREALQRFSEACTEAEQGSRLEPNGRMTTRQRKREAEKARKAVERILGRKD